MISYTRNFEEATIQTISSASITDYAASGFDMHIEGAKHDSSRH